MWCYSILFVIIRLCRNCLSEVSRTDSTMCGVTVFSLSSYGSVGIVLAGSEELILPCVVLQYSLYHHKVV